MAAWIAENLLDPKVIIPILIGIAVSLFFYVKSRRVIGAAYYISTDRLIGPMGPRFHGLEIIYDGDKITSFSASKIFLWNRETEAIRRQDIAPAAPLTITLRAPELVLDHKVLYCSSHYSIVKTILERDGCILISFDFPDPKR